MIFTFAKKEYQNSRINIHKKKSIKIHDKKVEYLHENYAMDQSIFFLSHVHSRIKYLYINKIIQTYKIDCNDKFIYVANNTNEYYRQY